MNRYPFETKTYSKLSFDSQSNLATLDKRLNVADSLGQSTIAFKVKSLLTVLNGNIEWYADRISKQRVWLKTYNVSTVVLIITIPILILCLTTDSKTFSFGLLKDGATSSPESFASVAVAILTSLLGLHKVISSWMDKRKLLGVFHEASSGLKMKLYAFEDEWNSRQIYITGSTQQVEQEFDDAVEKVIEEGRAIANEERKKYFETLESPSIDLANIFTSSFTAASGLLKNFQSKRFQRKLAELEEEVKADAEQRKLRTEISSLENKLILLDKWLQEVLIDLAANPGSATLIARKASVESDIAIARKSLIEKKSQLT